MVTTIKQKVITSGAVTTGKVDLTNYYTKEEVDALIPTDYLKEVPAEYITETELDNKGYITQHQDLSDYAKKSDIPADYLKEIPSEYITESELNEKGYLTEHQSLEGYAKKSDIPDTSNFATKLEIPDTSTLATKEQVEGITDNVYTKTEIDSKFGDIDIILDNINGEVV